jgi:hypothetical protein
MKKSPTDPTTPGPGWSVVASSNGTSLYASSDGLTTSADLNNANAWFVMKAPNSNRMVSLQRGANSYNWRVKYSFGGFTLANGTASKVPSASGDEAILWGGGTDASPVANNMFNGLYEGKYVLQCGADDSDGYGFYFFAYPVSKLSENNSSAKLMMIHDPLAAGSYSGLDTDPSVTGIFNGSGSQANIVSLSQPSDFSAQYFYGAMPPAYLASTTRFYGAFSVASYGFTMTQDQVCNPHTSKQDLFPCLYFCKATTDGILHNGYKGSSSLLFVGSGNLRNGDVIALDSTPSGTPNKIFINGFVLPWNTSYMMA